MYRRMGKAINADIKVSLNIAGKVGYGIALGNKVMSHHVTTNDIKPLIPCQGTNTQDLQHVNP